MRALIAEDDLDIARQLQETLQLHGFAVDTSADGNDVWFLGDTETYDVIVLDIGLPNIDGLTILAKWRENGNRTPVILLTARDTWREKVLGLRTGADDYLAKPFEMEELLARVEVLIRRAAGHANPIIKCGLLELEPARQRITESGIPIDFSALEFRLVAYLIQHQNKVISKTELNEHLYQQDFDRDSNVIEVLINRCRKKLPLSKITTLRGQGYLMENS